MLGYSDIPKDVVANVTARSGIMQWAAGHKGRQETLINLCRKDMLFWINLFVWTFDPRRPDVRRIPFITYPFQDDAFREMEERLGKEDIGVEKSRCTGGTWILVSLFTHRTDFFDYNSFLLASRNEALVDKGGSANTLFSKMDFIHANVPSWMLPSKFTRNHLIYSNQDTHSTTTGTSTTGEIGLGDRQTALGLDEFASFGIAEARAVLPATQFVTPCRIFVSTPRGKDTPFYDQLHGPEPCHVIHLHWSQHPIQRQGLYRHNSDDDLEILDSDFWLNATVGYIRSNFPRVARKGIKNTIADSELAKPHYPFNTYVNPNIIESERVRSCYYDEESLRLGNRRLIAQELDIDHAGSASSFFEESEIEEILKRTFAPSKVGRFLFDEYTLDYHRFEETDRGLFKLWLNLDGRGQPPKGEYVIGLDISAGRGASNSCMSIGCVGTHEKVASYVNPHISIPEFADLAVVAARLFHDAFMIYEGQGPGTAFTNQVEKRGYGKVYKEKKSKEPGWWATPSTILALMEEYAIGLGSGEFLNRDADSVRECSQYQWSAGKIIHVKELAPDDPSGAAKQHGDRVRADCLLWHVMKDRIQAYTPRDPVAPLGSMGWRDKEAEREEQCSRIRGNSYIAGLARRRGGLHFASTS